MADPGVSLNANANSSSIFDDGLESQNGPPSEEVEHFLDLFGQNVVNDGETSDPTKTKRIKREVTDELDSDQQFLSLYSYNDDGASKPRIDPESASSEITSLIDSGELSSFSTLGTSYDMVSHKNYDSSKQSLNSSGYSSANSPLNSENDLLATNQDSNKQSSTDPLSVSSPYTLNANDENSSQYSNQFNVPDWLKLTYPELFQTWENLSASEFYQGGVELLCSLCKKNTSSGFHQNLPLCEADRVGRPCTVCRLRSSAGFSYGLAICEADRLFIYTTLSKQTKYDVCEFPCPITVQKWCGYCRLRACLSTRGFRFSLETEIGASSLQDISNNSKKRKLSGHDLTNEEKIGHDVIGQRTTNSSINSSMLDGNSSTVQSLSFTQPSASNLSGLDLSRPCFSVKSGVSKAEYASYQAGVAGLSKTSVPPLDGVNSNTVASVSSVVNTANMNPELSRARMNPSTPAPAGMSTLNTMASSMQQRNVYNQFNTSLPYNTYNGAQTGHSSNAQFHGSKNLTAHASIGNAQSQYIYPRAFAKQPQYNGSYFDGRMLGSKNSKMAASYGVLLDPSKQLWVREQQEKFLIYHMRLYRNRGK